MSFFRRETLPECLLLAFRNPVSNHIVRVLTSSTEYHPPLSLSRILEILYIPKKTPKHKPEKLAIRCFLVPEMEGFEPSRRLPDLPHFECGPFNHLGTSPYSAQERYKKTGEISHRLFSFAAGDRGRTGMRFMSRRILSPVRLPIPPRRQVKINPNFVAFNATEI